ncbi:ectoine hydroxylase-related dioxygenase (phytanoyl-CoA dioxygenase family) [Nakamurella sp. UYEF19]|uniref:phytanoyl-CoA dioxygenase family protein n=1 Tax=Nakamurella sp. UYEF19 TaxID=1756392 RepID=UPI003391983C
MTNNLTSCDSKLEFERDGVELARGLLPLVDVETIRDTFMQQVESDRLALAADDKLAQNDILSQYPRFMQPHRRRDLSAGLVARKTMVDARITQIVTRLIGAAHGAQSMFYFKPPTARGQAMHQDNYFLRSNPETCLAAWIAIDDCDGGNGALSVVPGSHRMEVVCPEESDASESFTRGLVRPPEGMTAVQTEMNAGDVLFFHGSLVHGSLPNTSLDRFRRSLIFHYVPTASKEISRWYLPMTDLSTGNDVFIGEAGGGGPCGESWEGGAH